VDPLPRSKDDYVSGYRQAPNSHERTTITLVVGGGLRGTAYRRDEEASALSVVVKPAGAVNAD
jgi:hypothetical protein